MDITVYGATISSSEDDILTRGKDGKAVWASSLTKLSTNENEVLDYAIAQMNSIFNGFEFENNTDYEVDDGKEDW